MLFKKGKQGEGSNLQSQFTAYLVTALRRRKKDIIRMRMRREEYEICVDPAEYFFAKSSSDVLLEDLLCGEPTSFDDMYFENAKLERALWSLTERDRYVLFARVITKRSFEELAAELGISYKGVVAVYSRAIQKLKKQMEGVDK